MNTIAEIIEDIRLGKMVILLDDEDRENEGDIVMAAESIRPQDINFMAKEARGLICLSLTEEQCDRLNLPMMVDSSRNAAPNNTAFTVSIEASSGVSTGISAADRAQTIRVASSPNAKPNDIRIPGHIFPIKAKKGGVLKRAGHTEASVDLARLAGCTPAAVICEIMNEDGSMARLPDLKVFAQKHNIKIGTIVDLIEYRLNNESLVSCEASAKLPSEYGEGFQISVFKNHVDDYEHIAIHKGEIKADEAVLVRVHSECMTGDIFASLRCDCGPQLHTALRKIEEEGKGVLIYLRQEGRGIGLSNKIKAYALQEQGMDTVEANLHLGLPADSRNYGIGAQILRHLGVGKMRLMTNNPVKRVGLKAYGLDIVGLEPIEIASNKENQFYLETKKNKMGHLLNLIKK